MSEQKQFVDKNLSLAYYGLAKTIDELRIAKLNAREPQLREYLKQQIQHLSEIRRGMRRLLYNTVEADSQKNNHRLDNY